MSKKLCKDTEIQAFSHWHLEFSMARFWAVPVFCIKVWTVWSAYATADYPARPDRPRGQLTNTKALLTMEKYFSIHVPGWSDLRSRCWIKGLGKNPQKEWARSLFAVPFVWVSQTWPAGLRENGMSAKVRVRICRIMPQNVHTRPPFYSWEKFCMYTHHPTWSG